MTEAYIFDAVRTPRGKGKKDGGLHQGTPIWLLRTLLQALQQRNRFDICLVEFVVVFAKQGEWIQIVHLYDDLAQVVVLMVVFNKSQASQNE